MLALLSVLALSCPGLVPAADEALPLAAPAALGAPRAKIDTLIRAYLDLPLADQGLAARLRRLTVPASRADLLRVRLDVVVTAQALARIAATGAQVISSAPRWNVVVAEATMAQIDALARLPEVRLVAAALRPRHHASPGSAQPGTYVDGSAAVIKTDLLRNAYNVSGKGQTIGIISDSINASRTVGHGSVSGSAPQTLTATSPQKSGNLPAAILLCNNTNLSSTTDEGEAMMEGAYHLAPGAAFAFSPCGMVDTDMAANIGLLKSQAGCSVICDDIIFFDEPMFQDGPIAQAADAFVQAGGIYLTAAGNNCNYGILATYAPFSTGTFNNWGFTGANQDFLPLTIPAGVNVDIILEWNQPYQSYGLGPGSASDFDLYLYQTASTSQLLASSTNAQGTAAAPSGDPFEILDWTNNGSAPVTVYLAVKYVHGANANQVMRLVVFTDGPQVTSPGTTLLSFGTSFGHQSVSSVLTIAATDVSVAPQVVESFSSFGGWGSAGLPYYFDAAGAPLAGAPKWRSKPDLTAPDGVTIFNTGFAPAFYGTSDATPHAAAAAALAWCAQPTLSNLQVIAGLRASATPLAQRAVVGGSPLALGAAPNGWCGYGLVNAIAAVSTSTSVSALTTTAANGTYTSSTIPIQVTFTNPVTVSGVPSFALDASPAEGASYVSGSGTATLTFAYAIQPGDTAAALDAGSGAAITGGAITITGSPATPALALPSAGGVGSLSAGAAIRIDARIAQAITFPAIAGQVYGAGPLTLQATVSSGLAPVYSIVSGAATVSGGILTITGVGAITVAADQPGDATHLPASEVTQSFTVAPATANVNLPATTTVVYDALPQPVADAVSGPAAPTAQVTYQPYSGNPTAGGAASGAATITAPAHTGWYLVVATLDANHGGGSASGTLQITPAALTVSAVAQTIPYGTAPATLAFGYGPFQGADTSAVVSGHPVLATSANAGSPVGSYAITVSLTGVSAANYAITAINSTVTVTAIGGMVTLPPTTTAVYNAAGHSVQANVSGALAPTATVTYQPASGDPSAGGSPNGAPSASAPAPAGWYLVVATLDANHGGGSASGTLQITPAALTVTAAAQTIPYGTAPAALAFSYGPFQGADTSAVVSGQPVLATAARAGSAVGSYAITVSLAGVSAANYALTAISGTITVTAVSGTVAIPPATTVVYSAAAQGVPPSVGGALSPSATVTYQPLSGDPSAGGSATRAPAAGAPAAVGWYQVVATLDANHGGGSASGTLQITPAAVTVFAPAQSLAYGAATTGLRYAFGPFPGSDTSAVVAGAPLLSTHAVAGSPVGSYPITVALGTLTAADYTFVAAAGTLTIGASAQTITFAAIASATFGSPVALSANASSGLPVAFSVLSGPATVSGSTLTLGGTGTVVVAADQAGDADYLAAPEATQAITVAAPAGGASTPGSAAATASSGGGGSHCGLGSGAAAALLGAAMLLARLRPQRRRR